MRREVMNVLAECPVSILKGNPLAILVLMRSMFNWRLIPKMMELKVLFDGSGGGKCSTL